MTRPSGRPATIAAFVLALGSAVASGQTVAGRTPNLRPAWTLGAGAAALRIGHRFEVISGGDELLSIPTLTVALGLGQHLTAGLDFTSNSEVVAGHLGGNESQYWLTAGPVRTTRVAIDVTGAYNTAARSLDAALTGTLHFGTLSLLGEMRGFQRALGSEDAGAAASVGAVLSLTPRLELSGDWGGWFAPDGRRSVWSAGVGLVIPGSTHTLSIQATNAGATTLQGASHRKVLGTESVRLGFVFSVPLGSARQWSGIFRRGSSTPPALPVGADVVVTLQQIALQPAEIRIQPGQTVAWLNRDPVVHTITAEDGSWTSGDLGPGATYMHRFAAPGRYSYHCQPHPQMRGIIIVE